MAGVSIDIDDREVREALRQLERVVGDLGPTMAVIGEKLLRSHKDRFSEQKDPDGKPWAPLSPAYKARKKKNQDKVLMLSGNLRDLLRYQIEAGGAEMRLGTDRVYGASHQFGDAKRNLPARPFLGLSDDDKIMMLDVIGRQLKKALKT